MSAAANLERLLDATITDGVTPSYQALVVERGEVLFERNRGLAVVEPEPIAVTADTLYDLASLTKPLVTGLLALRLAQDGVVPLELRAARLLASMCSPPRDQVTVLDLLTHRAGFRAWAPIYPRHKPFLVAFAEAAAGLELEYEPGKRVVYSDLGYLLLGALLERATGQDFAALARRHVLQAVGEDGLAFNPGAPLRQRTAATERGNQFERRLAGADDDAPGFRTELIWGSVNDGHAFALGGIAPQAGLFATARGVVRLASQFLDGEPGERLLAPPLRGLARLNFTPFSDQHRGVGFELASSTGCGAYGVLAAGAFGHSGFTGTSVWIEPERQRIYVWLTNRIHPVVHDIRMNEHRRRFHAGAAQL